MELPESAAVPVLRDDSLAKKRAAMAKARAARSARAKERRENAPRTPSPTPPSTRLFDLKRGVQILYGPPPDHRQVLRQRIDGDWAYFRIGNETEIDKPDWVE